MAPCIFDCTQRYDFLPAPPLIKHVLSMEDSKEFKIAVERIKALEQHVESCHKALKECEENGAMAEQLIEEHFDQCLKALAARKAVLLESINLKITNLSMFHPLCDSMFYFLTCILFRT